jgi:hypothetical protein
MDSEIASYEGKPSTTISLTGNGFSNLSGLTALCGGLLGEMLKRESNADMGVWVFCGCSTFQNIKFNRIPVTLPVPETLAYLYVPSPLSWRKKNPSNRMLMRRKVDRCNVSDLALSTDSDIINLNEMYVFPPTRTGRPTPHPLPSPSVFFFSSFPDVQFAALPYMLYQRLYPKVIRLCVAAASFVPPIGISIVADADLLFSHCAARATSP